MDASGWSFNQRRKSMQMAPGQRRSLNIGNNVVSVDDLYKVSCTAAAATITAVAVVTPAAALAAAVAAAVSAATAFLLRVLAEVMANISYADV
jgi:hypothetical protein